MRKSFLVTGLLAVLLGITFSNFARAAERAIPRPLPSHPGNIFLADERISLPAPAGDPKTWQALDYEGKVVAKGDVKDSRAEIGTLPVGYYELVYGEGQISNRISLGVLEPLHAPTPLTSPIGIDVAMAWFFPKEKMPEVASLCQLSGMNRVRDRFYWGELEPAKGNFVTNKTRYDFSLAAQSAAGLQVLNVNHASPGWANPNGKHFPLDLRDVYNAYREVAGRWKGQLAALEPWNEADIATFGGHTGNEMASLQKAAYLGIKAGNPDLPVCMNVFAIDRVTTLRNFDDNKAWAYFDTYNLHHYQPFENFPKLYANHRAVSGGRPMWTTECSVTVQWTGDEKLHELNAEDARVQSERVARIYCGAIHEGSKAVFYFMLPHYVEGKTQYGVLHPDLTPRPGFLAVAAAGRLLADAQPLGRIATNQNNIDGFLFRAKPDGKARDVLVLWSEHDGEFELPAAPTACFDHLGRVRAVNGKTLKVGRAPIYALLAKGARPAFDPPPAPAKFLPGKPGVLVLQALPPEKDIVLKKSAYKILAGATNTFPIFLYNFGTKTAHGKLSVNFPEDWAAEIPGEVEIAASERKELSLKVVSPQEWSQAARVRIKGDFGKAGDPLLALRFTSSD